ncbi:hypothetical protein [Bradyrhizobium sp. 62]|uniref:hypothetical protein n=1 Tax=Bradyrhizobium sp. 62 TaxID=1043588 RepID=UPI001FFBCD44|nr:hypothetical protein [Bradyrhizobium sp. 62]MCK1368314.1 hypothetical protein [Bradyrhizobium sp. 62]
MFSYFRKGKKSRLSFSPPVQQPPTAGEAKATTTSELSSPDATKSSPQALKARGWVDKYADNRIVGWAFLASENGPPVETDLSIYFDGQLVGTTTANIYRADLEKAGHAAGRCSFQYTPPAGMFSRSQTIEVRTSDGQTIGKPFTRD